MKTFLLTGNDTGVGKTYCMGLLASSFARKGKRVQIIKAIDCGDSKDAETAEDLASSPLVESKTLFTYPAPLAPTAKPNSKGGTPSAEEIISKINTLPSCDIRLVEGAGGLAVPIDAKGNDWRNFIDLLMPTETIVIIENRLGAINQTRLIKAYLGSRSHCYLLNSVNLLEPELTDSNQSIFKNDSLKLLGFIKPNASKIDFFKPILLQPKSVKVSKKETAHPKERLIARKQKGNFRSLEIYPTEKKFLNLADNDYLNLRYHPSLIESGALALQKYGTSASASPLITGYTEIHAELGNELCAWYSKPHAVLWSSGYAANHAVLAKMIEPQDLVLADRLIHNSLIAGILKSKARFIRFRHNDLGHLENLLKEYSGRNIHLVTESVYSMEGDYPDLKAIAALKSKYSFTWYLDEAHGIGWYGATGTGLAEEQGVLDSVDILTGTLGKALASSGAFTLFKESWRKDICINEAEEFIYSTFLSPASAAIATAAIKIIQKRPKHERHNFQERARKFRHDLEVIGWEVLGKDSPIVPILTGSSNETVKLAKALKKEAIQVGAIRPPAVPKEQARIRISLKSNLEECDFLKLINILKLANDA